MKLKKIIACLLLGLISATAYSQDFNKMAIAEKDDTVRGSSGKLLRIFQGLHYLTDEKGIYLIENDTVKLSDNAGIFGSVTINFDAESMKIEERGIVEQDSILKLVNKSTILVYNIVLPRKETIFTLNEQNRELNLAKNGVMKGDTLWIYPQNSYGYPLVAQMEPAVDTGKKEGKGMPVLGVIFIGLGVLLIGILLGWVFTRKMKNYPKGFEDKDKKDYEKDEEGSASEKECEGSELFEEEKNIDPNKVVEEVCDFINANIESNTQKEEYIKIIQDLKKNSDELTKVIRSKDALLKQYEELQNDKDAAITAAINDAEKKFRNKIDHLEIQVENKDKEKSNLEKELNAKYDKNEKAWQNKQIEWNKQKDSMTQKNITLNAENDTLKQNLSDERQTVKKLREETARFESTFKGFPSCKDVTATISQYLSKVNEMEGKAMALNERLVVDKKDKASSVISKAMQGFRNSTKNFVTELGKVRFESLLIEKTSFNLTGSDLSKRLASQGNSAVQPEDLKYFMYEKFADYMGETVKLADIMKHLNDFPGVEGVDVAEFANMPTDLINLLSKLDISVNYVELYTSTENYTDREIDVVDTVENSGTPIDTIVEVREMAVNYGESDKKTKVIAQG